MIRRIWNSLKSRLGLMDKPTHGWFGNYTTWAEAKAASTGYDSDEILHKVLSATLKVKNGEARYERDSVVFDEVQYTPQVLNALKSIAEENQGVLQVIDFGGSLGSSFFQYKQLLPSSVKLNWIVVEQPHFVACGKKEIAMYGLSFAHDIQSAPISNTPTTLFLSSVLPYLEEPYKMIDEFKQYNFDYIIVDRTAFIEGDKERITLQIVPEFIYKASYPAWFFNEQKFKSTFETHYECLQDFEGNIDPKEKLDGLWTHRKGFIFKKKATR